MSAGPVCSWVAGWRLREIVASRCGMAQGELNMAGEEGEPWMPHNALDEQELNKRFPTVVVPGEEEMLDYDNGFEDQMFNKGMEIADQIAQDMKEHGRRR